MLVPLTYCLRVLLACLPMCPIVSAQDITLPVSGRNVLEGVQLITESGTVSVYCIFRDKPVGYRYRVDEKSKPNRLTFEFLGVQRGSVAIPDIAQQPLFGIEVQDKSAPDSPNHIDTLVVSFLFTKLPRLAVTDRFNIVTFTYPTIPDEPAQQKPRKSRVLPWAAASTLAAVAAVTGVYFLTQDAPESQPVPDPELSTNDLPVRR